MASSISEIRRQGGDGIYMISTIKKIFLISVFGFVAYKALNYYVLYAYAMTMNECTDFEEAASLKRQKASGFEVEQYLHKTYSCIKQRQGFLQSIFYPVPDKWLNPPSGSVSYMDIPDFSSSREK